MPHTRDRTDTTPALCGTPCPAVHGRGLLRVPSRKGDEARAFDLPLIKPDAISGPRALDERHLEALLVHDRPMPEIIVFAEQFAMVGGDDEIGIGR
jgi:hypothetical protein